MSTSFSRRSLLIRTGASLGAAALATTPMLAVAAPPASAERPVGEPFGFCLNTATIMGQKLPLTEQIEVVAKAGWQAIEPWLRDIEAHVAAGNSLADLKKQIEDLGLTVPSAMGFAQWAVEDDAKRAAGLEQMRHDMDLVRQLGGTRIAAPPAGVNNTPGVDLAKIGERYRAVLELGREMGVVPQLEIWGSAKTLGRVSEAAFVALEAKHPDACLLLDVYHAYRGGSGFDWARFIDGRSLHVLHMNDYPAQPPREELTDAQRVYPGDGVAPLAELLRDLRDGGFRGFLSLELFNRDYWAQDALSVARTGLEKLRAVAAQALA